MTSKQFRYKIDDVFVLRVRHLAFKKDLLDNHLSYFQLGNQDVLKEMNPYHESLAGKLHASCKQVLSIEDKRVEGNACACMEDETRCTERCILESSRACLYKEEIKTCTESFTFLLGTTIKWCVVSPNYLVSCF